MGVWLKRDPTDSDACDPPHAPDLLGASSNGDETSVSYGPRRRLAQVRLWEALVGHLVIAEWSTARRARQRPGRRDRR